MTISALRDAVHQAGKRAGLFAVGVCDTAPFSTAAATLRRRATAGLSGRLSFTFADPELAATVRRSAPWARSLVVGAVTYPPPSRKRIAPGSGRVAAFAVADAYAPLRRGLDAIRTVLSSSGRRGLLLVDDNRLVDRAAAVRAGVGWWGKSTMVLAPGAGPWLLLGSVATDAPLPASEPTERNCGTCDSCIPACPTGAILAPGVLDASRCISHWLAAPGVIPLPYRAAVGDRFYGCDECLRACPPGRRLRISAGDAAGPVDMETVLVTPDADLVQRFAHFYIPRRNPAYLRRNALVVVGNTGFAAHLPTVCSFLADASPMLRAHAVWSAARLGAADTLRRYARSEADPWVLAEYAHVSAGRVVARQGLERRIRSRAPGART